jgi:hypothetical protein
MSITREAMKCIERNTNRRTTFNSSGLVCSQNHSKVEKKNLQKVILKSPKTKVHTNTQPKPKFPAIFRFSNLDSSIVIQKVEKPAEIRNASPNKSEIITRKY